MFCEHHHHLTNIYQRRLFSQESSLSLASSPLLFPQHCRHRLRQCQKDPSASRLSNYLLSGSTRSYRTQKRYSRFLFTICYYCYLYHLPVSLLFFYLDLDSTSSLFSFLSISSRLRTYLFSGSLFSLLSFFFGLPRVLYLRSFPPLPFPHPPSLPPPLLSLPSLPSHRPTNQPPARPPTLPMQTPFPSFHTNQDRNGTMLPCGVERVA
ncbi:hypothetical protein BDQ12DRAFT_5486 [Crucibulum laeve]|uniref:Uncharacterized protein n=1 Tax=Crucibulum laeve TaxID=68775 RepID=A0A5C3MFP3_9AGAR|nr:hypothetical protein BDQ12DRAFT_5486 [Crucibulum laeve]